MVTKSMGKSDIAETLRKFFEEKKLENLMITIEHKDLMHVIETDVVIDLILNDASEKEQEGIWQMISKIDFANGDVQDYLQHLAKGYIGIDFAEDADSKTSQQDELTGLSEAAANKLLVNVMKYVNVRHDNSTEGYHYFLVDVPKDEGIALYEVRMDRFVQEDDSFHVQSRVKGSEYWYFADHIASDALNIEG